MKCFCVKYLKSLETETMKNKGRTDGIRNIQSAALFGSKHALYA